MKSLLFLRRFRVIVIYAFIFVTLLFVSCKHDGPCDDPYKWKVEYNSAPSNLGIKIKKNVVYLTVSGAGTVKLLVENINYIYNVSCTSGDIRHCESGEGNFEIMVKDEVVGDAEIVDNRVILNFYKAFNSSNIIRLDLNGLESGGYINITSVL